MSDNQEDKTETVKTCDNNTATNSLSPQNNKETTDANVKEDECSKLLENLIEDEEAVKCNDVDKKANEDIKDSTDIVNDCEASAAQPSDIMINTVMAKNDENKDITENSEPKELDITDSPAEDIKQIISIKEEFKETQIKMEVTEGKQPDGHQTRNLFETVGLVLRSSASQADSNLETEEVIEPKDDKNHSPDSTLNVPESAQEGTPSYCEFCGFPAANPDVYRNHMKFHDRTNATYTCYICSMKYKKRSTAVEHYQNTHNLTEAELRNCQTCKYVTSDEAGLKEHIRKHFLIRPHACGICYQSFATVHNYHRHMETKHTDVEKTDVGYTKPISKRRRGSNISQGRASNSNKRSRQNSKVEEVVKPSPEESKSSKSKPEKPKSPAEPEPEEPKPEELKPEESQPEESQPEESKPKESKPKEEDDIIQPKNYFVLPTKTLNLVCSFCETTTLNKRELSQHLLSKHGDEIITLKPF
ncbi:zinc finger and BTB domain-containing protein 41-like [Bolinopsis microptera]|uniref:zinc finger and BTB domain-containing protein 41-like n=1 Tax=Bolinopsis microptera TaxID=2820187 RepID=UPI003079B858